MMSHFGLDLLHVMIGIVIILVILCVGAVVFSRLTRFDDAKEINNGNEAAGIYMGSKLLGLCIIVAMVSFSSHDWLSMILWSAVGIIVLCLVYLIFDWLTPRAKVCEQISQGNMAVAQLLRSIIIGVSIVIGTFLM
jgi:putative membrane protein